MPTSSRQIGWMPWIVTGAAVGYAIVRYNGFQGDSPQQIPVFISNKGISFGGLAMLALSRYPHDRAVRRRWGLTGLILIAIHILLSLTILQPEYFGRWFQPDGRFTWQAELALLTGVVATIILARMLWATAPGHSVASATSLGPMAMARRGILVLTALHVGFMGYERWLEPQTWPGYMPPITLLSFVVALAGLIVPAGRAGQTGAGRVE